MKLLLASVASILLIASSAPFAAGAQTGLRGDKEETINDDQASAIRGFQGETSVKSKALSPLQSRVIDYPPNGIRLGQGWDSIYGTRKDAIGIIFKERTSSLGQVKTQDYTKVIDKSRLMQAMAISAEFQYSGITGSASAKFKFATKVEVLSTSQNFLAHAKVENGRRYTAPAPFDAAAKTTKLIDSGRSLMSTINNTKSSPLQIASKNTDGHLSVRLTPHALELAKSDIEEFQRIYGDSFVSAIHSGAELDASFSFEEQESEKIVELESKVTGSGWGFSGSTGFKAAVESYSKSNKLKVEFFQTGGSGDPIPTDVDGFLEKISVLPQLAHDAPYPHSITLQRYETLPNWPQDALPKRPSAYEKMLRGYFEYKSLYGDIVDVEENHENFLLDRGTNLIELRNVKQELHKGIRALESILLDFKSGIIDELPANPTKPDYNFRIKMPIPNNYDIEVSPDMDSTKLKNFITKFWLKQPSDNRCKYRGYSDEGCLSPKQLEKYASQIKVTHPLKLTFVSSTVSTDGLWGGAAYSWVGDFNGDGKDDIASADGKRIFLKLGTKSGFTSKTASTDGYWGGPGYTWVGDFNGDGKDDIASGHGNRIFLKLGTTSGFTSKTVSIDGNWGGSGYTWVGDFNGDGKQDIASANGNRIFLKLGTTSGFVSKTDLTDGKWGGAGYTWVGDFNGDGKDDIASAHYNMIFLKRSTNSGFVSETISTDGLWGGAGYTKVGDFNGDGKDDIASADGNRIFLKQGTKSGFESKMYLTDGNWGGAGYTWVGDFSGYGKDGIASANNNILFLKLGTNSGFKSKTVLTDGYWGGAGYTWVGDFDGDGKDDIASANGNKIYLKRASMVPAN